MSENINFPDETYRMGFRFYTPRLTYSGISNTVSVVHRYGYNPSWCVSGSCSITCGTGDRMFYCNFYMMRNVETQNQWRYWNSGDYYDMTFSFSSIGEDSTSNYDHVFITASLIWETSRYYNSN